MGLVFVLALLAFLAAGSEEAQAHLDPAGAKPAEVCLATCIGQGLEEGRPGSAAAVWCGYGGGARWACLTMLVDRDGLPACEQLLVTPRGEVVESRESPCPIRLEQPLGVHTK